MKVYFGATVGGGAPSVYHPCTEIYKQVVGHRQAESLNLR